MADKTYGVTLVFPFFSYEAEDYQAMANCRARLTPTQIVIEEGTVTNPGSGILLGSLPKRYRLADSRNIGGSTRWRLHPEWRKELADQGLENFIAIACK